VAVELRNVDVCDETVEKIRSARTADYRSFLDSVTSRNDSCQIVSVAHIDNFSGRDANRFS
jgi:hypothetical protein